MENYSIGLTRSEYQKDKAQFRGFELIESDWKEIYRWIMSISETMDFYDDCNEIGGLWYNHILTVLIEIIQTDVNEYKNIYIQGRGTINQSQSKANLFDQFKVWIDRIDNYLQSQLVLGRGKENNPAIKTAHSIRQQLYIQILPKYNGSENAIEKQESLFYDMLGTIADIKDKGESYISLIEKGEEMDPALSLLLTFIRNYCSIIKQFNQTFSYLPEFYRNKILMVTPQDIVQDKTLLVVTPANPLLGYTLPSKTKFSAGTKEDGSNLLYQTEKDEYLSGIAIKEAFTIFQKKEKEEKINFYKQTIEFNNPDFISSLFTQDKNCTDHTFGWMIESRMFILKEGNRSIEIDFILTQISALNLLKYNLSEEDYENSFSVLVSDTSGWSIKNAQIISNDNHLIPPGNLKFSIKLGEKENSLVPCSKDLHQIDSKYPIIKIISNNKNNPYKWGKELEFTRVNIYIEVDNIHNFNLYNELGEIDASKPFYPFGIQAERGAWFMFGNEEISQKNLTELKISGVWSKLPSTDNGYTDIYKDYPYSPAITNESFIVKCEYQQNEKWVSFRKQQLFAITEDKKRPDENASILFDFRMPLIGPLKNTPKTEQTGNRDCLFRVILEEPTIGFGMEEYRILFAEIMIHNSRHNKRKKLPTMPIIPILSDTELSYKAIASVNLTDNANENDILKLSRITVLSENEFKPISLEATQRFFDEASDPYIMYMGLSNTFGKQRIRMYFDLILVESAIIDEKGYSNKYPTLKWEYFTESKWEKILPQAVLTDETSGLTQSGFIELELPERVTRKSIDYRSLFWLRAIISEDIKRCLAIRCIYLDCINVIAENGNGSPLPSGTIQQLYQENKEVDTIIQPLPGYGGKAKESKIQSSIHQCYRIANRKRVIAPKDFEQMVLEQFQDIEKVCCIPINIAINSSINIVIFSHSGKTSFPITPSWKLNKIRNYISTYISPFVTINVINPIYQPIKINCQVILKEGIIDTGEVIRRMKNKINNYFAKWIQDGTLPEISKDYSYKELHTRLANDKDIIKLIELTIDGKSLKDPDIDKEDLIIRGKYPWNVLIPKINKMVLIPFSGGINESKIGYDFIIG